LESDGRSVRGTGAGDHRGEKENATGSSHCRLGCNPELRYKGSSDSSIRNVEPTDIRRILAESQITRIYANGNKAGELYRKYQLPLTGIEATVLPSTSPANAAWRLESLCEVWRETIVLL